MVQYDLFDSDGHGLVMRYSWILPGKRLRKTVQNHYRLLETTKYFYGHFFIAKCKGLPKGKLKFSMFFCPKSRPETCWIFQRQPHLVTPEHA